MQALRAISQQYTHTDTHIGFLLSPAHDDLVSQRWMRHIAVARTDKQRSSFMGQEGLAGFAKVCLSKLVKARQGSRWQSQIGFTEAKADFKPDLGRKRCEMSSSLESHSSASPHFLQFLENHLFRQRGADQGETQGLMPRAEFSRFIGHSS